MTRGSQDIKVKNIHRQLVTMASLVEKQIYESMVSLKNYDIAKAEQVIKDDDKVDEMQKNIEEKGFVNMAQRYFGLHYKANWSCIGNEAFKNALLEYGFTWIEGKDFPEVK